MKMVKIKEVVFVGKGFRPDGTPYPEWLSGRVYITRLWKRVDDDGKIEYRVDDGIFDKEKWFGNWYKKESTAMEYFNAAFEHRLKENSGLYVESVKNVPELKVLDKDPSVPSNVEGMSTWEYDEYMKRFKNC
jgi:hypothetical protein